MFIITNGVYAVGPFKTREDAREYRRKYANVRRFKIMEILEPSSEWQHRTV